MIASTEFQHFYGFFIDFPVSFDAITNNCHQSVIMNLQDFYKSQVTSESTVSQLDALHNIPSKLSISPSQGSRFAKQIAQDFNPLHDVGSKRFCVPGDLLFTLVLSRFGLSQHMHFDYQGMVGGNEPLEFIENTDSFRVVNSEGKPLLSGTKSGDTLNNESIINGFCQAYVAFSGQSFPHILVPLMRQENVMINPSRPMVIYESMDFKFERAVANLAEVPSLELSGSEISVEGKRAKVTIHFAIKISGRTLGNGYKSMTLSGLKPFEESAIDVLVADYEAAKLAFQQA